MWVDFEHFSWWNHSCMGFANSTRHKLWPVLHLQRSGWERPLTLPPWHQYIHRRVDSGWGKLQLKLSTFCRESLSWFILWWHSSVHSKETPFFFRWFNGEVMSASWGMNLWYQPANQRNAQVSSDFWMLGNQKWPESSLDQPNHALLTQYGQGTKHS